MKQVLVIPRLGMAGTAALVLIGATAWFYWTQVTPLKEQRRALGEKTQEILPKPAPRDALLVAASAPSAKLAAFRRFFERDEEITDWLAKIHLVANDAGMEFQLADYKLLPMAVDMDRIQINVPLKGTSAQIRAFASNTLASVPVLSLDQVSFRRKRISDAQVEADVVLSLYMPRK
jgi:Tfp pilus assembly protein PilO